VNGNPFPNAPKYTFDFTARYSVPGRARASCSPSPTGRCRAYTNFFLYQSKEFYSKGDFEGGLKLGYANKDGGWEVADLRSQHHQRDNIRKGAIDFNNLTPSSTNRASSASRSTPACKS
jgi:iron complex outermembrane receptor protein